MRTLVDLRLKTVAGIALAALAASACHPLHLHHDRLMVVAARLDCPETDGLLTRVSAAPDGNSCIYQHRNGDDVTVTRLALNGQTPQAALAPIDADLKTLVPAPPPPTASSGASASSEAAKAESGDSNDNANVDVPGVHVQAHGDNADVNVMGITVHARGEKANVQIGNGANSISVVGNGESEDAQVRVSEVNSTNARITYVLAGAAAGPSGYRSVGYLARGPVTGPLVVVVVKSRINHGGMQVDRDLRRLLDLNVRQ